MIKAFQSPSNKTAGDFPGEEIAASDLGLAPPPFLFVRQQSKHAIRKFLGPDGSEVEDENGRKGGSMPTRPPMGFFWTVTERL